MIIRVIASTCHFQVSLVIDNFESNKEAEVEVKVSISSNELSLETVNRTITPESAVTYLVSLLDETIR